MRRPHDGYGPGEIYEGTKRLLAQASREHQHPEPEQRDLDLHEVVGPRASHEAAASDRGPISGQVAPISCAG